VNTLPDRKHCLNNLKFILISKWLFPLITTISLIILTILSISGSSIGAYNSFVGKPSGDIIGQPRTVRSDEWDVNTTYTIAQSNNHFRVTNKNIDFGQNMSVETDVPYKAWSIIFHPQNLLFLILPLSNAFAFKWWFLSYILLISVYIFVSFFVPNRRLLAILISLSVLFSPFIQWWYQSITILPIAYTLVLSTLAMILINKLSTRKRLLLSFLAIYLLTCFVLIMYPPFQIPCALVGLFIFIAYYFYRYPNKYMQSFKKLRYLILPIMTALVICLMFIISQHQTISLIERTVYPGRRIVNAGGQSLSFYLSWPLNYMLQFKQTFSFFPPNQSESSRFLLFGIALVPYYCYYFFKKRKVIDSQRLRLPLYLFIASMLLLIIFLSRSYLPIGNILYRFMGLSSIPHDRLLIAFGIINFILIMVAFMLPGISKFKKDKLLYLPTIIYFIVLLPIFFSCLYLIKNHFAIANLGKFEFSFLLLILCASISLLIHRLIVFRYIGLSIIVAFGIYSSLFVNPLIKGLSAIQNNPITKSISKYNDGSSKWIINNDYIFEGLPISAGVAEVGGVQTYPNLWFWGKYFSGSEQIYNRYAHVELSINDKNVKRDVILIQADTIRINISSCDAMLQDLNVNYMVSIEPPTNFKCFHEIDRIQNGSSEIGIFKRNISNYN